jgi:hypothetical protein
MKTCLFELFFGCPPRENQSVMCVSPNKQRRQDWWQNKRRHSSNCPSFVWCFVFPIKVEQEWNWNPAGASNDVRYHEPSQWSHPTFQFKLQAFTFVTNVPRNEETTTTSIAEFKKTRHFRTTLGGLLLQRCQRYVYVLLRCSPDFISEASLTHVLYCWSAVEIETEIPFPFWRLWWCRRKSSTEYWY